MSDQRSCESVQAPGRRRSLRRGRRGGAALEFMLVLPTLMLVLVGMLSLSTFLTTRYFITAAALHAARTCAILRNPTLNCAQADVAAYLPLVARARCNGLQVTTQTTLLPGTTVNMFDVSLNCAYNIDFGGALLQGQGIQFGALTAKGSMPLQ